MPQVIYSPRALIDLEEITDYIARDNPHRAFSFGEELRAHCARAAESPAAYVRRDDIAPGARMAMHGRYRILFQRVADGILIVRVVHGARLIEI